MDLAKLFGATKSTSFEFLGGVVELEVYTTAAPQRLTKEQRAPFATLTEESDRIDMARVTLPMFIKSWNLSWDGELLPVTVESLSPDEDGQLAKVSDALLLKLMMAVEECLGDDPTSAEPSDSGSAQTEK